MCLMPPRIFFCHNNCPNERQANGSWLGYGGATLVFYEGQCIKFPYHEGSNLLVAKLALGITKFQAFFGTTDAQSTHTQQ
jgi:hypothetical protein